MSDLSNDLLLQMHEQQTTMSGALGRIEAKLDEHKKAIDERVAKIESSQSRQWWYTMAIAPALALAHAGLRYLGVKI